MTKHSSYTFTLVLAFFSLTCLAQKDTAKVKPCKLLEITGGALFPTAPFAQSAVIEYGAYTGYNLGASLSWPVKGQFSGTLRYMYGINQFNAISTDNTTSYVNIPASGVNYYENIALIGACYTIPGDDKASIDVRVAGGALLFTSPQATYAESNIFSNSGQANALPQSIVQTYTFTSIILNAGASLHCKLGKRIIVSLNLDYYYSPGNGTSITTTYNNSSKPDTDAPTSFTFYSMFNPSLGFGYKIGS
jgi:hypothetical protein